VPLLELARGEWEDRWVLVQGVVAPDGDSGKDWVGISQDGWQTRGFLLFHRRDFRRCRAGETVTVEEIRRRYCEGVVEVVECRFRGRREVLGVAAPSPRGGATGR
jgi:hypothetical protein